MKKILKCITVAVTAVALVLAGGSAKADGAVKPDRTVTIPPR